MLDLTRIPGAVRYEGGISRRLFLAYGAALAALPSLAIRAPAEDRKVTFSGDPFSLGVASGDPTAEGVVLWTKLAPKPLDPDGGMRPETVSVAWQIGEDESLKKEPSLFCSSRIVHALNEKFDGVVGPIKSLQTLRGGD